MRYIAALFFLLVSSISIFSQSPIFPTITNPGFERSIPGAIPYAWYMPTTFAKQGYKVIAEQKIKSEGKFSLSISSPQSNNMGTELDVNVHQKLDAIDLRGKMLRFEADYRIDPKSMQDSSDAFLFVRIRESKSKEPIFVQTELGVLDSGKWERGSLEFYVDPKANEITYGIYFVGEGTAYLDDTSLEYIINPDSENVSVINLDTNDQFRLKAFAKSIAYNMFFNPLYGVNNYDWERFHLFGIKQILDNDEKLEDILNKLFDADKNEIKFYNIKKPIDYKSLGQNEQMIRDSGGIFRLIEGAFTYRPNDIIMTSNYNSNSTLRKSDGVVYKVINVEDYAGKKIRFSAKSKLHDGSDISKTELWMNVRREDRYEFFSKLSEKKSKGKEWQELEIIADLPEKASIMTIGLVLFDEGTAYFDDLKLEVEANSELQILSLDNQGFEADKDGEFPSSWTTSESVPAAGYRLEVSNKYSTEGNNSLMIKSNQEIKKPKIFNYYTFSISDSIKLAMPSVFTPNKLQFESFREEIYNFEGKPRDYLLNGNDAYSRLAIFIYAWNMLRYFSNASDVNFDLLFDIHVDKIARSIKERDFQLNMLNFLSDINDGNSFFGSDWHYDNCTVPFSISSIDTNYFINNISTPIIEMKESAYLKKIYDTGFSQYVEKIASKMPAINNERKRLRAVEFLRHGQCGDKIPLEFVNTDGVAYITQIPLIFRDWQVQSASPAEFAELNDSLIYVNLTALNNTSIRNYTDKIISAKNYIFDLRGNTSLSEHFLGILADENINPGYFSYNLYSIPDKNESTVKKVEVRIKSIKEGSKKAIFIIDETTTGYSAYIAYLVKKYKLGKLIGRKTEASSMGLATTIDLFGNYYLSMSFTKGFDNFGKEFPDEAITPDLEINKPKDRIIDSFYLIEKAAEEIIK